MTRLKISFTVGEKVKKVVYATSESNMWVLLREIRDSLTEEDLAAGSKAVVTNEDGTIFKEIKFKKQHRSQIDMPDVMKKRIRRGFTTIILQMFDTKSKNLDQQKYGKFRTQLQGILEQFDKLVEESKKEKKADKRKFKSLAKFTKEELENYLKTMK